MDCGSATLTANGESGQNRGELINHRGRGETSRPCARRDAIPRLTLLSASFGKGNASFGLLALGAATDGRVFNGNRPSGGTEALQ
jgi:hypothetical protein